jgi:NAD(P)-dependent dehydrogenase (short-subunit alcohol dehydrogenase family)
MLNEHVAPEQAGVNEQPLEGKCALVTGGTTGIGRATARLLAKEGARVMIFGRGREDLDDALAELRDISTEVYGTTADQAVPEDVDRVFRELDENLGGLDVLINNAAVSHHTVAEGQTAEWMYTIQANLIGYMKCTEQAIPRLKGRGGGWIVNVGSMSAKVREAGSDVYVTSKMGIRGFSDSIGKHLAEHNIHVTLIEPGLVLSELAEMDAAAQIEKQQKMEMILGEDIGRAILFSLRQPDRVAVPFMQMRPLMQLI